MKHKTTMYRQGKGWIVSRWNEQYQCYVLSHEMPYTQAREACGRDNRRPRKAKATGEGER